MILRILYHLGLTNLSREQYLNLTKNEPYKIMTKLTNILLFTMMVIVMLVAFFILTGQTEALTLHQYEVPEYLSPYVSEIKAEYNNDIYMLNGQAYKVLASADWYGVIRVYDSRVGRDEILHEIGHLYHWREGYDPYKNTEFMANMFMIEAKRTSNLAQLRRCMRQWRKIYVERKWVYN